MRGELSQTPLLQLVWDLLKEKRSGLLEVRQGKVTVNICLLNGQVQFLSTNLRRYQPVAWLEEACLLPPETAAARQKPPAQTRRLVDQLVAAGAAERARLVAGLRHRLRLILREALAWRSGSFCFTPGTPVLRNEIVLDEPTARLLTQAPDHSPAGVAPQEISDNPKAPSLKSARAPMARRRRKSPAATEHPTGSNREPDQVNGEAAVHPEVRAFLSHVQAAEGRNFYGLLEIDRTADEDTIRNAYYALARKFHPDRLRGPVAATCRDHAETYFAGVSEAYNTLARPERRAEYDKGLQTGRSQRDTRKSIDSAALARQNFEEGRRALAKADFHRAAQFFENAVTLAPERAEYHRELGIVCMHNPRWKKKAEESLCKAVEIQPADTRALVHLGTLYRKNGLKHRAMETFRRALQWDPENEVALQALADQGDDKDAGSSLFKTLFGRS
ncbi:MAG: DnaJ domain-containing protein [Acidobacteriota bacterium]